MFNLAVSIQGIHDGVCNVVQASPIGCLFDFPPLFRTQLLVQTAQAAGKELTIQGSPHRWQHA